MSTLNAANIRVGQSSTPDNNITLSADSSGNLVFNKGNSGALTEITRITNAGLIDASKVAFTPAGTGAVSTTTQSKLRDFVSVKDFGAKGDGVTDDTAAIINAQQASRLVYFPSGTYLTDTIRLNSSTDGAVLYGNGFGTIIKPKATASYGIQIEGTSGVSNITNFKISDIKIDMSLMANTSGVSAIYQRNSYGGSVDNITVTGFGSTNKSLILKDGSYTTQYSNCTFGTGSRIDIIGASAPNQVTTITFINCDGGYISADWATSISFIGGAWQATGGTMLTLGTVINFRVYGVDIENYASYFSATASTHSFISRDNAFSNITTGTYPFNSGSQYPTFYTFHDGAGYNPYGNVGSAQQIMGITLGGGSATLSISTLEYNVSDDGWVTFQGLLQVGSVTTPSGAVTITNLPRTVRTGNSGFSAICTVGNGLTATATGSIVGYTIPGTTTFGIQMFSAGARSDIGAMLQANCTFVVSGKYRHA